MNFLPTFPSWAAFNGCPITRESTGRCVEIVDLAEAPSVGTICLSEKAVKSMAAHYGMVDAEQVEEVRKERDDLQALHQAALRELKELRSIVDTLRGANITTQRRQVAK